MNEIQFEKFLLIKKVFFADTCAHMQCIDNFVLPNWNSLNYRSTDTDTILEGNKKNTSIFTVSTKCDSLPRFCIFLPIINHLNLHVNEISNFSVRELMWVDFSKCRKII